MSTDIGGLTFSYASKDYIFIEEGHWFWVYNDAVLSSGEKVDQISVEYYFIEDGDDTHPPVRVYFETKEGELHQLSQATKDSFGKAPDASI